MFELNFNQKNTVDDCIHALKAFFPITKHNPVSDIDNIKTTETTKYYKKLHKNTRLKIHCIVGTIISQGNIITRFFNHRFFKQYFT